MVKLKTVLDVRRTKSDGTYPIVIRITNYKEVKYFTLGVAALKKQWDESTLMLNKHHPNATTINALISKRYFEIQKAILKLEETTGYSYESLKSELEEKPKPVVKDVSFLEFSQTVIDDMLQVKRTGNAIVYRLAVNRLMGYCKNPRITFKEIDYTMRENKVSVERN